MLINTDTLQILDTGLSAAFAAALTGVTPLYDAVAMTINSSNRATHYAWVNAMPQVREWLGDRVIKQLSGQTYTLENKSFESTIEVYREDIEDNQIDLASIAAAGLATSMTKKKDKLVWDTLASGEVAIGYDGVPFFSDAHPTGDDVQSNLIAGAGAGWYVMDLNQPLKPLVFQLRKDVELVAKTALTDDNVFFSKKFIWGADARFNAGFSLWQLAVKSKATLTEANLAAARSLMLGLTDDSGEVMGIMPTALVVGRSNLTAGEKLINSLTLPNGESNINKGAYKLVFSPYLP